MGLLKYVHHRLVNSQKRGMILVGWFAKLCLLRQVIVDYLNKLKTGSDDYLLPWLQNNQSFPSSFVGIPNTSVPLVYLSNQVPISCCVNYYTFLMSLNTWYNKFSHFTLCFSSHVLGILVYSISV